MEPHMIDNYISVVFVIVVNHVGFITITYGQVVILYASYLFFVRRPGSLFVILIFNRCKLKGFAEPGCPVCTIKYTCREPA